MVDERGVRNGREDINVSLITLSFFSFPFFFFFFFLEIHLRAFQRNKSERDGRQDDVGAMGIRRTESRVG